MALRKGFKSPGVYIDEKNAFPHAVIAVETAVPAFIGYTEKADHQGKSISMKSIRIESFAEFIEYFGEGAETKYGLEKVDADKSPDQIPDVILEKIPYLLETDPAHPRFHLFDSMKLFYQNGGGSCFVISIGTYTTQDPVPFADSTPFIEAIRLLEKETVPTMIVIPDAVLFENASDCYTIQQHMLTHCGEQMNRVAILDVFQGDREIEDPLKPVETFREGIGTSSLEYGIAYYPWLHTSMAEPHEISYKNLNSEAVEALQKICSDYTQINLPDQATALAPYITALSGIHKSEDPGAEDQDPNTTITLHKVLHRTIPPYKLLMDAIQKRQNLLPPSAAMAGMYTMVDRQRGVWQAPANLVLAGVIAPSVQITTQQQEDLNAPVSGKAICAIRTFIGKGTLVWGARTLDANSLDWRYINVRRTMIMIEQSLKFAVKAYVFEPNVKNTWTNVGTMITYFLTNLWKMGALAGAIPSEAFSVNVGLGSTMTPTDILEGMMRIEVKVAVSRPAEFIVISMEQPMQKS